jgi:hypothetical protein
MPRKGQPERLSRLQREILKFCKTKETRTINSRYAIKVVAYNMGIGSQAWNMEKRTGFYAPGWYIPNSFEASFSRSLRNLIKKGIIEDITNYRLEVENGRLVYAPCFRSNQMLEFRLTDRGKTLMLSIES